MDDQNRPDNRMDDFRRTYENTPETYETAGGEPVEPTPPQQTPVTAPKKKSNVGKWLLWAVVVLLLAGLGALAFWQWNDARNARAEASMWHTALQAAQNQNKKDADADKTDQKPITSTPTTDEAIETAAKNYHCNLANAGCEKVTVTINKKQMGNSSTNPSFAIVSAGDPKTGAGSSIYLKSVDNFTWVVIYEGQNTPPADVVKKFAIPASFTEAQ